jgi:hypothetical protein
VVELRGVCRVETTWDRHKGYGARTLAWAGDYPPEKSQRPYTVVYIGHSLKNWYEEEIAYHRKLYYAGRPEISDKAYDELVSSFRSREWLK